MRFLRNAYRGLAALFVCLIITYAAQTASAAPISDKPKSLTQPDGGRIECLVSGDEFFNYLHDASGNLIMLHPETGYYVYAELDESGRLAASDTVVPAAGGAQPRRAAQDFNGVTVGDIDFTANPGLIRTQTEPMQVVAAMAPSATSPAPVLASPVSGRMENVIVMICFADESNIISTTVANKINSAFNGNTNSLKDYMKTVSGGMLEVNSTLVGLGNGTAYMYKASQPRSYYQPYNSSRNPNGYRNDSEAAQREHTLLRDAINAISGSSLLSGKNLDFDNNGRVDDVTFVVSGDVDDWSDLLWPHKWSLYTYNVSLGGKRVYEYSFQLLDDMIPASGGADLSVICHETLHVFGFPDLYRYTDQSSSPVSVWDIMGQNVSGYGPQLPNSHTARRYAGWGGAPTEITQSGRYTLYPLGSSGGVTSYAIPTEKSNQYILLEYRYRNNGTGYDPHFGAYSSDTYKPGLVISRINTSFSGNANTHTGATGRDDEVYVFRPNETIKNAGTGGMWDAVSRASLSQETGRTALGRSSGSGVSGIIYLYDGSNTNIVISGVSGVGSSISFDVKLADSVTEPKNSTVSPSTAAYSKNGGGEPSFTLTLNGNTFKELRNGSTALTQGVDYIVSGNTYTIKSSYLNAQNNGSITLAFEMSAGVNPTVTVVISGATTGNSSISPNFASYNKNGGKEPVFTLAPNGNTFTAIKNGSAALVAGSDYTVSGNAYTIKKSYLNAQILGDTVLTFEMSDGINPITVITISDTTVTNAAAPVITSQPKDVTVKTGDGFSLSAAARSLDGGSLSYTWYIYKDGAWALVENMTGSTFTATANGTGTFYYYVLVTNTNNSASGNKTAATASNAVKVTVNASAAVTNAVTPVITSQPKDVAVKTGEGFSLSVSAYAPDGGTLSYRWYIYKNSAWALIESVTGPTFTATANGAGAFSYFVSVTNTLRSATGSKTASTSSKSVKVTVKTGTPPPPTTTSSYSLTVTAGPGGSLSVTSKGSGSSSQSQSSNQNGTVMTCTYAPGTQVTLTATPSSGRRFKGWQVAGGGISLADTTARTITFTMPSGNVELKAVFE